LNSAEFCWLNQLLLSSAKFYQTLLKSINDCVRIYTHITTKNHNYLIIRFSRYSFFSLYNVLFFTRAIPLNLNKIYIIPLDLPWSLFAPLHYITLIPTLKMANKLKSATLTIITLVREQMTIIQESFINALVQQQAILKA
jgi:hypothetical protein